VTADDAFGGMLRAMLGPPEPQPGPPYEHVHSFPQEHSEDEAWEPPTAAYTVVRRGRQYENAPIEAPAAFRRLAIEPLPMPAGPGHYFPPADRDRRGCSPS